MEDGHWSDEDFVGRLYGVGPANDHLEACEPCRRQWERYLERRQTLRIAELEIAPAFLAAQRTAVLSRLPKEPRLLRFGLLPSFAALLLALVILTLFRPAPGSRSVPAPPDTELYEDVFSLVSSTSPSAVEPLESLFEVQQ